MKYEQAEHCYPHPPIPTVVEAYENAFGLKPSLKELIETAINKVSAENGSDTPDFILAEYLVGCLAAYDKAVTAREKWYGRAKEAAK